jgi:AraC-like DNA-binding protein
MYDPCIMSMTFGHWGFDRHQPGAVVGPRPLRDLDLILITAGGLVWEVDGAAHDAIAPCLLLGRPGQTFTMRFHPGVESRNLYIHCDPGTLPDWLPGPGRWPALRRLGPDEVVPPLMHHLAWLLERRGAGWAAMAALAAHQILGAALLGAAPAPGAARHRLHPAMEGVVAAIRRGWRQGLRRVPVDELAAAVGLSPSQLHRLCVREIGCAPAEAERLVRLEFAATRLADGGEDLAAIAAATGFSDAFHLSRCFRAAYGRAPAAFRREVRAGAEWGFRGPPGIRGLCRRLWEGGPD